jgi:hypothetical protein
MVAQRLNSAGRMGNREDAGRFQVMAFRPNMQLFGFV